MMLTLPLITDTLHVCTYTSCISILFLQSSSPEHSFVEILHSELSKRPTTQVKFHPYHRSSSGSGHYADLAHAIGSDRKHQLSPFNNKYVEALHNKLSKSCGSVAEAAKKNPYVEALHQRLNKTVGKPKMPPTLARSPVAPTPRKSSAPVSPVTPVTARSPPRNEYVESLHTKLQKMRCQPVAPCPGVPSGTEWWSTTLEKV